MAFQKHAPFADFLRRSARAAAVSESAPATNFLLDECVPPARESGFLVTTPGAGVGRWDTTCFLQTFNNHFSGTVALPARRAAAVSTFAAANRDNHPPIESNQDVVRLESILGLYSCYPGDFASPSELAAALKSLVEGRLAALSPDRARLELWLDGLNQRRDARPTFAAPFGELEPLMSGTDWAPQLRNVLGLAHLGGSPAKPLPVVLCRYSLTRVEHAARRAHLNAWAATPTVLEAGGKLGPGTAFLPFPRAAAASNPFGFGITVNLAIPGSLDFKSELLHARIDYRLGDFASVGELTDEISDAQLAAARQGHLDLLNFDFIHRTDVP